MKWKEYSLDELIHIKHGYAFKGEFFSEEPTDDILLTPGNFAIGGGFKAQKLKYYNGEFPVDYILDENDVIVTMTDLSKEADTLGFSAKVPAWYGKRFLHNQRIGLVKLKTDDFDKDYLYWLMRTFSYQRFVANGATGATVKHTSPTKICQYKFIAPDDKTTQRKIASILSAYDDLIENNLKRIKLLEEKAFVSYKLLVKSEKFLTKAFSEVADFINGYPFKPGDWKEEGLPIIKIKELKAGVQNDTHRNDGENIPEKYFIENKDILFAWSASIGAYLWCSGKSILNQHIFNVKPFDKDLHNWLYFSLLEKIPDFINLSNGATMQHIKKSALGMVYLPVPPKKIYEEFQKETDPVLNLIVNLHQQNTKLREARDILLPKLMNGQIEV